MAPTTAGRIKRLAAEALAKQIGVGPFSEAEDSLPFVAFEDRAGQQMRA